MKGVTGFLRRFAGGLLVGGLVAANALAATKTWTSNSKLVDHLNSRLRETLHGVLSDQKCHYRFSSQAHKDFEPIRKVKVEGLEKREVDYVSYRLSLVALEAIYGEAQLYQTLDANRFSSAIKDKIDQEKELLQAKKRPFYADHFERFLYQLTEEENDSEDGIRFPLTNDEFFRMVVNKAMHIDFIARNWVAPAGDLTTQLLPANDSVLSEDEQRKRLDQAILARVHAAIAALNEKLDLTKSVLVWDQEWQHASLHYKMGNAKGFNYTSARFGGQMRPKAAVTFPRPASSTNVGSMTSPPLSSYHSHSLGS